MICLFVYNEEFKGWLILWDRAKFNEDFYSSPLPQPYLAFLCFCHFPDISSIKVKNSFALPNEVLALLSFISSVV